MENEYHDGLTNPEQANWMVWTKSSINDSSIQEFFMEEKNAYRYYQDQVNSLLEDRVLLMQKKGAEWEKIAEDGVWSSTWRPENWMKE